MKREYIARVGALILIVITVALGTVRSAFAGTKEWIGQDTHCNTDCNTDEYTDRDTDEYSDGHANSWWRRVRG